MLTRSQHRRGGKSALRVTPLSFFASARKTHLSSFTQAILIWSRHAHCAELISATSAERPKPPPGAQAERPPSGVDSTWRRSFVRERNGSPVHWPGARHTMPLLGLRIVTINIEEGVLGRGTEHPRALALAPGGIPAPCRRPWPFERGQKWPLQTDVDANNFARLRNYLQWRPAREIELSRFEKN